MPGGEVALVAVVGLCAWRKKSVVLQGLLVLLVVAGMILAFARALGEFGATIMVAGNIPGKTSTLSLSIFQSVQIGEDSHAFRLLGVSVVLAFVAVWCSELMLRRNQKKT